MKKINLLAFVALISLVFAGCPNPAGGGSSSSDESLETAVYTVYSNGIFSDEAGSAPIMIWTGSDLTIDPNNIDTQSTDASHSGNKSIKIVLDDQASQGWAGAEIKLNSPVELTSANVLSVWLKNGGSEDINVTSVGFGNASSPQIQVDVRGDTGAGFTLASGSDWQEVVVPIPDSSKMTSVDSVMYITTDTGTSGSKVIYIDDIKYKNRSDVEATAITLGTDITVTAGASSKINTVSMTYRVGDYDVVIMSHQYNNMAINPWLTWSSDNESVATVSSDGTVTGVAAGTANITAALGSLSATIVANIITGYDSSALADDFEGVQPDSSGFGFYGSAGGAWLDTQTDSGFAAHSGTSALKMGYGTSDGSNGGFYRNITRDWSGYTNFTFYIRVADASSVGQSITLNLFNDDGSGGTSYYGQTFTIPAGADSDWVKVSLPLSDYQSVGCDLSAITGYGIYLTGIDGTLFIDDVSAE